jgi:hypothetical protein
LAQAGRLRAAVLGGETDSAMIKTIADLTLNIGRILGSMASSLSLWGVIGVRFRRL